MGYYQIEPEKVKNGNPIARNRFRWQTYTKETDEPMESEWEQFKNVAIQQAAKYLIRNFNKWGIDDINVKVFNEMNHMSRPTVITLQDALKIIGQ